MSEILPVPPEVRAWLDANVARSTFAQSLSEQAGRRGGLTPGQIGAVLRGLERERECATLPDIDTTRLERVFEVAASKGLKKPALQIGSLKFNPAPANGANPGAIYVKEEGVYMGKVLHGRFLGRAGAEFVRRILEIAGDPLGAAINHGKLTGRCAICSRALSDPESVERGIGPICASKFGW